MHANILSLYYLVQLAVEAIDLTALGGLGEPDAGLLRERKRGRSGSDDPSPCTESGTSRR
ncbi:hypothetical protein GCM10023353_39530 [Tomitella cavernea]|uniref:Uncharacterized protein n=1 Tax=Tomitella cavernea TaxID=1387982 RepID=A0ABP9D2V8_9ACTN